MLLELWDGAYEEKSLIRRFSPLPSFLLSLPAAYQTSTLHREEGGGGPLWKISEDENDASLLLCYTAASAAAGSTEERKRERERERERELQILVRLGQLKDPVRSSPLRASIGYGRAVYLSPPPVQTTCVLVLIHPTTILVHQWIRSMMGAPICSWANWPFFTFD